MELDQGVGIVDRDLFNLNATFGAEHKEMLLGRAVKGVARVVLLGNVGRVGDEQAVDDVTFDVHAQNVSRVEPDFIGIFRDLHTTRFAASTYLDLGFDHDGVTGRLGHSNSCVDVVGGSAGWDG